MKELETIKKLIKNKDFNDFLQKYVYDGIISLVMNEDITLRSVQDELVARRNLAKYIQIKLEEEKIDG